MTQNFFTDFHQNNDTFGTFSYYLHRYFYQKDEWTSLRETTSEPRKTLLGAFEKYTAFLLKQQGKALSDETIHSQSLQRYRQELKTPSETSDFFNKLLKDSCNLPIDQAAWLIDRLFVFLLDQESHPAKDVMKEVSEHEQCFIELLKTTSCYLALPQEGINVLALHASGSSPERPKNRRNSSF